jgi:hypothetical protein
MQQTNMQRKNRRGRCYTLLVTAILLAAGGDVFANGKEKPAPKTSTGRELTGPGAHHEEYTVPPDSPRVAPPDTVRDARKPLHEWDGSPGVPKPDTPKVRSDKPPEAAPRPGVDDKSSTRPGE